MGRWEPDARGRLRQAALDLYTELGYEQTTVVDIAERAGVTERTFFRHFTDKREVLFDGAAVLEEQVVAGIAAAPAELPPVDVVAEAFAGAAGFLQSRPEAGRRAAVVAANPSLQERELLKMASLGASVAAALRERGVPEPVATLAAETGVTIFSVGFRTWVTDPAGDLAAAIRGALAAFRSL